MFINVFLDITCNIGLSICRSKYFNIIHSEYFNILYITYLRLEQLYFYISMHPKLDNANPLFYIDNCDVWLVSFNCFNQCVIESKDF